MGVPWSLYAARTLSTWGDNMWWFAGAVPVILHHYDDLHIMMECLCVTRIAKLP